MDTRVPDCKGLLSYLFFQRLFNVHVLFWSEILQTIKLYCMLLAEEHFKCLGQGCCGFTGSGDS